MPTIIFPDEEEFCPDTPYQIEVVCEDTNSVVEWSSTFGPIGAGVTFNPPNAAVTTITVDTAGSYEIQACCTTDDGTVFDDAEPALNCPLGLIAGTTGSANLVGCANGTVAWSSSSGDLVVTPQPNGNAILTALITGSGTATITATCTINGVATPYTCDVNLVPPDTEIVCETSPPVVVVYETCGERCDCVTRTVNFDCAEFNICDTAVVFVEVKDCTVPEEEPCIPSIPAQLMPNV